MLHHWTKATDEFGDAVRVVLFDYRKAFDSIDHNLLVHKVLSMSIPRGVAHRVADKNASSCLRNAFLNGISPCWGTPGHKPGALAVYPYDQ